MRIFDNLLYKVLAVMVAGVLWATAQGFRDDEMGLDLPIALEDVSDELVVVDQSAYEINVRIAGSRAALRQAERNLVRYAISLAGVKPGEARYSITTERIARSLPRGARISARSPSSVVVHVEPVVEKRVRVRADVAGELPEGLKLVEVRVDPTEVQLAGAKTEMRRLDHVVTERVDISELRETTTLETSLILGYSHVWRMEEDAQPVEVQIEIESEEPAESERAAAPGGGTG